ncbi:MAG: hydroxymethylpyrimidine/phosphomethylpyrimidine kinase, partial [Sneathiella sp.]|nr:hydroxymethylpyrimidine/phosphomethylpyrimidine kinase [Sneathiella sp.]
PIVLDPVMIAKGGASLLSEEAEQAVLDRLVSRHTTLLTPNIPEAEKLIGMKITTIPEMKEAAIRLMKMGPDAVLMKGGHMVGTVVSDLLASHEEYHQYDHPRIMSKHTHGTGCTLSSAIATGLAQKLSLVDSVERGLRYVELAIETAPGFGRGHGPLNHGHMIGDF